jgi:hypothetical protein
MDAVLQQLRNTPIPVVLIWSGLIFLLIPFLTKIGGIIEIQQSQKRPAFVIGAALLALGMALNLLVTTPTTEGNAKLSEPERFLREYYAVVNKKDYGAGWNLLTDDYKKCSGDTFAKYTGFWDTIASVMVTSSEPKRLSGGNPVIRADLRYVKVDDRVVENTQLFELIKVNDQWMINGTGDCIKN